MATKEILGLIYIAALILTGAGAIAEAVMMTLDRESTALDTYTAVCGAVTAAALLLTMVVK